MLRWMSIVVCCLLLNLRVWAHPQGLPSITDTVAGVLDRLGSKLSHAAITKLTVEDVLAQLTPLERVILATGHIHFTVDQAVVVTLLQEAKLGKDPFWLAESGFRKTALKWKARDIEFQAWEKEFPAGEVRLGVNSLSGNGEHYMVFVKPVVVGGTPVVSGFFPPELKSVQAKAEIKPYADLDEAVKEVPQALQGQTLIQTLRGRRTDGRMLKVLLLTSYPSSRRPDHFVLTWSGDPKTTQTIQWRTGPQVRKGRVQFQKKSRFNRFKPAPLTEIAAVTRRIDTPRIVNDRVIHWHRAELTGLEPGETYVYSVGDGSREGWSELREFTTAPAEVRGFSFTYMGDAQNGLDRWGMLVRTAFRSRPDSAFYLMAGDLVNRGAERDDWDQFFHESQSVYDRRSLVPVLGNHECQGGRPDLYLKFFGLPTNGPVGIEQGRAYAFEYSNAQFVILDSNLKPETQTNWLDRTLAASKARWKFVSFHHPAYSSGPKRDNKAVREVWGPILDKHHVDLALQGHDHAYLRTYPMKGGKRVASPKEGTVYIVSVSGTKFYEQDPRDYTEFGMTKVATYQVLDLQINGDRLVYKAVDIDGKVRDELVIEK